MPRIHVLSQSLINKIAAGEVIERPASVVKELMENAVDAGATRIDVAVAGGGVDLVRVADNGCGIEADQLPLAVASHATSKIEEADDLFRVGTLGFRGEALASIAEISRLVIRSRTAETSGGWQVEVSGGQSQGVAPCGCPVGTTVEVHNLFFNTPVRRKFLRSTQTELGHVSEAFTRIALAAPETHFTLQHNERTLFDLSASTGWLERIATFFGRDLADNLVWVESSDGSVRLSGYVALPTHSRSNNRMQYLFLNRRHIRDRSLQHALGEAYRGLLLTGRFPVAFLALELPADLVDVNVHPTKLEVRFQDGGRVYSQLLSTLRTKFLSTNLTPRVAAPADEDPTGALDSDRAAQVRQELVDWAKGQITSWGSPSSGPAQSAAGPTMFGDAAERRPLELNRLDRPWTRADAAAEEEPLAPWDLPGEPRAATAGGPTVPAADSLSAAALPPSPALPGRPLQALQIHNRYLVVESQEGVVVIDQHALHERILYEHLRNRVLAGAVESQALLVPEPLDLAPAEAAAVLEHRELLAKLGMKVEPFGGGTVLVSSYPAMLANISPGEVLRGLVDTLLSGAKLPDRRDMLDELLHMISCKAAIKAGDRLTPEEIAALLAERHLIDDAHHCPHGRPTALVFTREELDKQFKRI
jgi:DNA mismatch repair protein MutL